MKTPIEKPVILLLLSLLCIINTSVSQESINASAQTVKNETGSVSYSVGQTFYSSYANSNGSINEGIQLLFEILVITGIEETDVQMEYTVFPNPAENYLILEIKDKDFSRMFYQVYNLDGKLLINEKISSAQTTISLRGLAPSTYFIKIMDENQEVKTFKVIKR